MTSLLALASYKVGSAKIKDGECEKESERGEKRREREHEQT